MQGVLEKRCPYLLNVLEIYGNLKMFSFRKLYLLECVGFLNVANLFPDVCTIVGSKVFEANI